MAKKESTFINMVFVLFVVAAVAGLALGYVYNITKEPIAKAKQAKIEKAIREVLPSFDSVQAPYKVMSFDGTKAKDSLEFFDASLNGQYIGTAVNTYTMKGFSGLIKLMVGFKPDGTIVKISVLEHKETPGLGTKMVKPKFKDQFFGKNPADFNLKVNKDGGDVDAITAATISSRAYTDAVKRAYQTFMKNKGGNN
ncbi:MAG: RnfABCDGE type electron transport complex subunit G [Bacteroidetes bacterium 4572_77]|nr:MAG: RnfABCDGE type electron transport complex subunit G [Bacteroidetes bacterium 4572_77]